MTFFELQIDPRDAQYARLTADVLRALQQAVQLRMEQGETKSSIAKSLGCHRSVLTRILNGSVRNLTLRTISDILWATQHEPDHFRADPYEVISSNYVAKDSDARQGNYVSVNLLPRPISTENGYFSPASPY